MPPLKSVLLGVFLAGFSFTTAAPHVVPASAVESLEKPFSLSALTDDDPVPWTVIFSEIRFSTGYTPFITRESIAEPTFEPLFTLSKGKLTVGPASDNLTAYFGPALPVFPPLLDALYFDDVEDKATFFVVYNSNAKGNTYLELRTSDRNFHLSLFVKK